MHGALWDLLIPQQAAACECSIGACASSGVRLQAVLADCESAQGVMRLHTFLQLYTTAAACSGGTDGALRLAPLLTRSAQAALSRLLKPEGLTALAGLGINCEGASRGSAESALVSSPCGEGTSDRGLPAASSSAQEQDARPEGSPPLTIHYAEDAELAKNVVLGHEQLQARRALQLQPACVRMLKLLCMVGESKTD